MAVWETAKKISGYPPVKRPIGPRDPIWIEEQEDKAAAQRAFQERELHRTVAQGDDTDGTITAQEGLSVHDPAHSANSEDVDLIGAVGGT